MLNIHTGDQAALASDEAEEGGGQGGTDRPFARDLDAGHTHAERERGSNDRLVVAGTDDAARGERGGVGGVHAVSGSKRPVDARGGGWGGLKRPVEAGIKRPVDPFGGEGVGG
jgi:hypothetical protein